MSQIASFYLIKNNQRQELSDGDCSGAVYMAIWDWCESELDLDVRFPAPQTEDTLDCALLEGELASQYQSINLMIISHICHCCCYILIFPVSLYLSPFTTI